MSMFSGGFFGGGTDESKSYTSSNTNAQDQRVAVGGSAGIIVAPGATMTGVTGGDIAAMLDTVFTAQEQSNQALSGLASSLGLGLQAQAAKLGDIVEATKAPSQAALSTLLPWLILGLVFLLWWGK